MENFKEIAEKCLAGELSGVFIFNTGIKLHSQYLKKSGSENYFYLRGFFIDKEGHLITKGVETGEIINFIPDNMQEQIKIDIPDGKVPVMEQTESGVVITWKDKELTYTEIYQSLWKNGKVINYIPNPEENTVENLFIQKVNALRKLTNIRNYFRKPDGTKSGYYIYKSDKCGFQAAPTGCPGIYANGVVAFKERKHAEQAIKMLGDELKYLFEPW